MRLQADLLANDPPQSIWCANPHCKSSDHSRERDNFVINILEKIVSTSYSSIPLFGGQMIGGRRLRNTRVVPGWIEAIEPYRQESCYWGDVWKKEGRPSTGWLHDLYVRKRAQYHYAIRRANAAKDKYRAEGLLTMATLLFSKR